MEDYNDMTFEPLSRRTFLRGVGTAMALPMLESMLPLSALAQSAAKAARVNRMAFIFVPNGVNIPMWTPAAEGALELSPTLASMSSVKNKLNVSDRTGAAQCVRAWRRRRRPCPQRGHMADRLPPAQNRRRGHQGGYLG